MSGSVADERALVPVGRQEPGAAWFVTRIVVGTALFMVHVLASFTVSVLHCDQGMMQGTVEGIATARLVLVGLTLGTLVAGMWLIVSSALVARRLHLLGDPGNGRGLFTAVVASVVGGILTLHVVWALVVATMLPLC
jgi:hypothetical protein